MLDEFYRAFPFSEACFQTLTEKQFCIYDHEIQKRCYVQDDPEGVVHFTVINPSKRAIHLLAVDGCLLSSSDPARCDCVLFDNSSVCLVEIKTVGNRKKRIDRRKDAENQLKGSATFFREKLSLDDKIIEAYVCLLEANTLAPCTRTNSLIQVLRFAEMGIALQYTNEKIFP